LSGEAFAVPQDCRLPRIVRACKDLHRTRAACRFGPTSSSISPQRSRRAGTPQRPRGLPGMHWLSTPRKGTLSPPKVPATPGSRSAPEP